MADLIKISSTKMAETIAKYEQAKTIEAEICDRIRSLAQGMEGIWEGPAYQAFINGFLTMHGYLQESELKLQDAIDGLKVSLSLAQDAESSNTQTMHTLNIGESPF